jgi:hypothetical protein
MFVRVCMHAVIQPFLTFCIAHRPFALPRAALTSNWSSRSCYRQLHGMQMRSASLPSQLEQIERTAEAYVV